MTTPEVSAIRDADRIIGLLEHAGITEIGLVVNGSGRIWYAGET